MRERAARFKVTLAIPCLDEAIGEVTAGGHQEGPTSHRDIGYAQCEKVGRRPQHPRRCVEALERARPVDEHLQSVTNDFLGEGAGRVVGARGDPAARGRNIAAAGGRDVWAIPIIAANQGRKQLKLPVVDPEGPMQIRNDGGWDFLVEPVRYRLTSSRGRSLFPDVGRRRPFFQVSERIERFAKPNEGDPLSSLLPELDNWFARRTDLEFEEALIDVSDLFHV